MYEAVLGVVAAFRKVCLWILREACVEWYVEAVRQRFEAGWTSEVKMRVEELQAATTQRGEFILRRTMSYKQYITNDDKSKYVCDGVLAKHVASQTLFVKQ